MSTDTCRRIHVARPGYMLTVSRRHNYYSFRLCHGVSLCIQQQTGDSIVADTRHMLTATSGYKWIQLVSGKMYPGVNAALYSTIVLSPVQRRRCEG